ncbi:lysozyme inhibitor LprI family protein [Flavobacterium ovatum]|uniref:lysozyme inhibitor LprI family protein n=1 Tax=Flavobacterium ovatum TaxID=1928857 RepID=UPI00344D7340
MKIILTTICLMISVLGFSQTQLDLNSEAIKDYNTSDKKLNQVYQQILREYKSDLVFIANFKKAQRLWVQFRDAEMNAKFPDREVGYYGSVQPMCWNHYLEILTNERITKLKTWIIGIEEGDVCTGTVKVKN